MGRRHFCLCSNDRSLGGRRGKEPYSNSALGKQWREVQSWQEGDKDHGVLWSTFSTVLGVSGSLLEEE